MGGFSAAVLAAGLLSVAPAFAQDAGSILQQQIQTLPSRPAAPPQPQAAEPLRPPAGADASSVRVRVQSVTFTGAEGLASKAELDAVVRDAIGKELNFAQLEQLADTVTRFLKSKGWLLARAYLPRQDLTAGRLEIAILQGRLETGEGRGIEIVTEGELRTGVDRIRRTVAQAVAADGRGSLTAGDLERAVLLVNDLAGVQAQSTLERGAQAGTVRLRLNVSEPARLQGSAWLDNYGNRFTGAGRVGVLAHLNSPAGEGDRLSLLLTQSEGVGLGQVSYGVPIGYSGLSANLAASHLRYEIGKEQGSQESRGVASTVSAGLTYPVLRSRRANLVTSLGYDRKWLKDDTLGANVRDKGVDSWVLGLGGDRSDNLLGGGLSNFVLRATFGRLDLSANANDLVADQSTARANGSFTKLNFSLARLQGLGDSLAVFVAVNGQATSHNLDSSMKFQLGGPSGVRAYPTGEGSGDRGWASTVELRHDITELRSLGWGEIQVMGFYDYGRVTLQAKPWAAAPTATGQNDYSLAGAGIGLNLEKQGHYSIRIAWSRAIGDNPGRSVVNGTNSDGKNWRDRAWVSAVVYF